jgi:hypothetical protein
MRALPRGKSAVNLPRAGFGAAVGDALIYKGKDTNRRGMPNKFVRRVRFPYKREYMYAYRESDNIIALIAKFENSK